MNVAQWLNAIDLGQYAALFHEHKIDAGVLPDLVESDLEKIGVPLGHRKRLMRAIAALSAGGTPPSAAKPASAQPSPPRSGAEAERRPITVMFCDLVGSTSLTAKLDAEDWRNLVNAYLDAASAAVNRLGGHVLKRLGDGLMALFGYPQAQENDAERAVLAIQRALAEVNARNVGRRAPQLIARIGLESGQLVVDAAGEVFGEAPNVAARVQAVAEPGSILITAAVQRQTAGLFVAEDRGAHALKGVAAPVTLYRIVRASGAGRRSGQRALTPLVGRKEELDLLSRRWERARKGEGQLALVVGEPGIGKSRLIEEFRTRLGETPHTWTEWSSSQLLQNTPLHPIAEYGRQRFGADLPAEQRLADIENALRLVGLDAVAYASLLAPMVDIPLPKERAANFAPEELRRRQLAAMTAWTLAAARTQPVVLAFEDLHWDDPTSLDLMRTLADRGAQAPLLIIATTRPEFRPPWSVRSHHSVISLSPLDRAQVARMVGKLASRHALTKEVIEGVSERTGGVPLFVEEVTRLLLERGEAGGLQAIPPTLQQSLAARLDRLGEAREVAQIGAVLGRDFTYTLLRAVGEVEDCALQSALDRLAGADLLIAEGAGHEANYRFKHALIQDAAYDSLLKSRRQGLHRRAAELLRDEPERAGASPEVIAHHFTQAGLADLAIEWWGKAGDQALRRSAFQEAIAHLGKAIAMADKTHGAGMSVRDGGANAQAGQRLQLQTSYGKAVMLSEGFGSEEAKAAFARAQDLATGVVSAAERFDNYFGQWVGSILRGEIRLAREAAEKFLRDAIRDERPTEAAAAHRCLGMACLFQGDPSLARAQFEQALKVFDPQRDREAMFRFGTDTGASARVYLALANWSLGDAEPTRKLIEEAVERAVQTDHAPTLANVNWFKVVFDAFRDDAEAAQRAAESILEVSRAHGLGLYLALGALSSCWARARLDGRERGVTELRQALTAYTDQGNKMLAPLFQGLLAEVEGAGKGAGGALARVDEALADAVQTDERWTDALLHRIRGDILLKANPADPARAAEAYLAAIAVAREQGTRSFGLQAALALAKLYQSTGRPVDAHAVLAPALEGFSPTPEMPEIDEAHALIERFGVGPVRAEGDTT
jgi:class 3 adenylate cyclase/predicted ATPase